MDGCLVFPKYLCTVFMGTKKSKYHTKLLTFLSELSRKASGKTRKDKSQTRGAPGVPNQFTCSPSLFQGMEKVTGNPGEAPSHGFIDEALKRGDKLAS